MVAPGFADSRLVERIAVLPHLLGPSETFAARPMSDRSIFLCPAKCYNLLPDGNAKEQVNYEIVTETEDTHYLLR